jgi:hypothetical protein
MPRFLHASTDCGLRVWELGQYNSRFNCGIMKHSVTPLHEDDHSNDAKTLSESEVLVNRIAIDYGLDDIKGYACLHGV